MPIGMARNGDLDASNYVPLSDSFKRHGSLRPHPWDIWGIPLGWIKTVGRYVVPLPPLALAPLADGMGSLAP